MITSTRTRSTVAALLAVVLVGSAALAQSSESQRQQEVAEKPVVTEEQALANRLAELEALLERSELEQQEHRQGVLSRPPASPLLCSLLMVALAATIRS